MAKAIKPALATVKAPHQMGVNRPARPKGSWQDWRTTRSPMPKAGTRRKKVPMPKLPKNIAPVNGAGVSGRI